nr:uncharacterized mitochondrial protein AtMg00810-like [Tanacetum cinerariifolium]
KALYGLHQAPRAWYETLATYLLENGFQRGTIDQTLFIKKQKEHILLVQIYVDDIIFGATNKDLCRSFEKLMKDKFQMSFMGELTFFLGLQVKKKEDGIFISQDKYVAKILRTFGLTEGKSASTPIDTEKPLLKDPDGEDVDVHIYRSMIGSLMYLTSSRPDIMFAVCACTRFQVTPKASHLYAVKRIFRYLKGKPHLGLWYLKDSPFDLVAYLDSDYAGAILDRKSTTRGCQFLGCRLISWQCKKQTVVATSSTEAEYVAAASLQVEQKNDGIFISQDKYVAKILKKFGLSEGKSASTPIDAEKPLLKDSNGEDVDVHTYRLISWQCKKQTVVATSSTETEYVAAASGCAQVLWIQNQLLDYGLISWQCKKQTVVATSSTEAEYVAAASCCAQEAVIREILRLDDAEGVDCLPNEEIFTGLARMGYEKPSTKLMFYKDFFSSKWKFLIHTILQSLNAKRTSWNESSSAIASAVICLSTGHKFNFLKYIFESLVRNVDSSSKYYMYPRFLQLIIQNQLGDLSTHTTTYTSPALTQKVFANMRRVRKGLSGVETPLFEGMLVAQENVEEDIREEQVPDDTAIAAAQEVVTPIENVLAAFLEDVHDKSIPSPAQPTPPPQSSKDIPSTTQAQSPL